MPPRKPLSLWAVLAMSRANLSIFVPHVGCPHRCSFCNQNTISGADSLPHANDIASICEQALADGIDPATTEIAFFGGSFTAIPRSYMLELLEATRPYAAMGFGIRCSTRPDAITPEILDLLKSYGVTSIELGVQSMCDEVLEANERGHTSMDVINAASIVKANGFTLGLQMMVGLYKSTPERDMNTASELIRLGADEVRIYPVAILNNTKLGDLFLSGEYVPYPLNDAVTLCAELLDMFESADIRVIKLGLHASELVEADLLGGLYHPAFRELCESERFYKLMLERIGSDKSATFTVLPKDISKALGQKRANITRFAEKGIEVTIRQNPEQSEKLIRID